MTRYALKTVVGLATVLGMATGCAEGAPAERASVKPAERASVKPAERASVKPVEASQPPAVKAAAPAADTARVAAPAAAGLTTTLATGAAKEAPIASALKVKRFVVTSGVKDREPLAGDAPLLADGSAIFAFAELSNPIGESENVRITFERKAGAERVGNVTLPVPAQVSRHRTWAMTRFIRAAGVWDAVLWSESGQELGRTSFEVSAS